MAFYYVDYENVHLSGLKGIEELNHKDEVYIYCRDSDIKRIETSVNKIEIKSKVKCIVVEGVTKNALDFELLSDFFVSKKHDLRIIVSKDKGYDAAIHKGIRNKFLCMRRECICDKGIPSYLEDFGVIGKEKQIL